MLAGALMMTTSLLALGEPGPLSVDLGLSLPPPPILQLLPARPREKEAWETAPDRPSTGLGLLITGIIMSGVGVTNLAVSPICRADFYVKKTGTEGSDACFYTSLVVGGAVAAVGIPLLIVGISKRMDYVEWRARHQALAGLSAYAGEQGGGLAWQTSF